MKKFDEWNINDYESNINKPCFLEYLYYLKEHGNRNQILDIIKASGCLISYNENFGVGEEAKREVEKFVKKELSKSDNELFVNYAKEAKILSDKRTYISKLIDEYIELYDVSIYDLIKGVSTLLDSIKSNEEEPNLVRGTIEYTLFSFSAILKVLKYYSSNSQKTMKANVEEIVELLNLANGLREINEIIQAWMYGKIIIYSDEDGVYISEDVEGDTRNRDKLLSSISFFDIKDAKELSFQLEHELPTALEINEYRRCLEKKIEEYFYTKDYSSTYLGVKLECWIKAYTFFYKLAKESVEIIEEFSKKSMLEALMNNGISYEEAKIVLSIFEYRRSSEDIYDAFLIPQDENVIFVPNIYVNIDPSRAMMSIFGTNEKSKIEQKGEAFEGYLNSLIRKCGIKVISNVKGKLGEEIYEIDLLFQIDNILFVCECKTQSQHEDMRGYFRNLKELDYYIAKFKRNIDFFFNNEKGKKIIETQLKEKQMDISSIEKIEYIYISNIFFTQVIYDYIYITDAVTVYRYFKRQPSLVHEIIPKDKQYNIYRLFTEFYEGPITGQMFIKLLMNKEKEIELNNRRICVWQNKTMERFQLSVERLAVNSNSNYLLN